MPLTLSQLNAAFKDLGKMLYLGQLAAAQAESLEDYCLATVAQASAGADPSNDFSFNLLINWQQPFLAGIQGVVAQQLAITNLVKSATDNYLLQIGNDIGASGSTSAAYVATLLPAAVAAASGSVTTWVNQDDYHSFYQYFSDNYNIALPQSNSPTFPDAWITVTIV